MPRSTKKSAHFSHKHQQLLTSRCSQDAQFHFPCLYKHKISTVSVLIAIYSTTVTLLITVPHSLPPSFTKLIESRGTAFTAEMFQ